MLATVSEWLLFNTNSAIFQLHQVYLDHHAELDFFIVLAHWNNSFFYVYDAEENKKQHIWHFIFMFGVKSLDFLQNDKQNMLKLIINLIDIKW
jgi:hypothetical protein